MNAFNSEFATDTRDLTRECYQLLDGATALGFMASQLRDVATDAPMSAELRDTMAFLMDQMSDRVSDVAGAVLMHFDNAKRGGIRPEFAQLLDKLADARAAQEKALDAYNAVENEHGPGSPEAKSFYAENVDEIEDQAIAAERALAIVDVKTMAELVAMLDALLGDSMLPDVEAGIRANVKRMKA